MQKNHSITISHLKPSPLLVATSSLLCLPSISMIIHKPYHELIKNRRDIIMMFIMSTASICRWGNPNPLTCKLDRFLAKLCFVYFVFLHITLNSNIIYSLLRCFLCVILFKTSRYLRKIHPHSIWILFHMSFHLFIIYFAMNDVYYVPIL